MGLDSASPLKCLVFDSGVGGLTVVEELVKQGFAGEIAYAADTGFFPYGTKSDEALTRRIPTVCQALYSAYKPDILVMACNTASTLALTIVREVLPCPVVGTVPAIKPAAAQTRSGVIGLLATEGTLRRAYTDALIDAFARDCRVIVHASPRLVELAEAFASGESVPDHAILSEIDALFGQPGGADIDTVVLACTHFPLLRPHLERLGPENVAWIDSGEAIARRVITLSGQSINSESNVASTKTIAYRTDETEAHPAFNGIMARFGFERIHNVSI